MKLLTHNMLACHIKGVTNNFPLKIEATKVGDAIFFFQCDDFFDLLLLFSLLLSHKTRTYNSDSNSQVETVEADFDPDFLRDMIPRLEWGALAEAAASLGCDPPLPATPPTDEDLRDDDFLKRFHHALLEVCLIEGALVCPETGRKFPVEKGIPNMLLTDDEC